MVTAKIVPSAGVAVIGDAQWHGAVVRNGRRRAGDGPRHRRGAPGRSARVSLITRPRRAGERCSRYSGSAGRKALRFPLLCLLLNDRTAGDPKMRTSGCGSDGVCWRRDDAASGNCDGGVEGRICARELALRLPRSIHHTWIQPSQKQRRIFDNLECRLCHRIGVGRKPSRPVPDCASNWRFHQKKKGGTPEGAPPDGG